MSQKFLIAVILTLLFVGGGVCYLTLVRPAWRGVDSPQSRGPESPLTIETRKELLTAETGVEGHRDFRFWNQTNKPATIHLDRTDCDCARVSACLTPAEWKDRDSQAFISRATDRPLSWQMLEPGRTAFAIPPRTQGLLRVTWKSAKIGSSSIGFDLRVDDGEHEAHQWLELQIHFSPPVLFCSQDNPAKAEVNVGRLRPGEERTARFYCFTTTRDAFTLTPAPPLSDPCIVYDAPRPLTKEELQDLSSKPGSPQLRACFRVNVTVREQANGHRLDIGPFHRKIVFTTDVDPDHKATTYINGTVEGEVALAGAADKEYVDFGSIQPNDPKPVPFTLETHDPNVQVTLDEKRTTPLVKVQMLDGEKGHSTPNGKNWRVSAVFRSDSPFRGPFPNNNRPGYDTAVLCSIVFIVSHSGKASSERRLIVPVQGNVRFN